MTIGNFEREPNELPEDRFRVDEGLLWGDNLAYGGDSLPGDDEEVDTEVSTGYLTLGTPGNYSFVELTTDEEMRDGLKPVFAGSELLEVLRPTDWGTLGEGEIKILDQPRDVQEGAQETSPYIVAQDLTPGDVIDMVSSVLHPKADGTNS